MEASQSRDRVVSTTSPPAATLTVAAVARRLGVAPSTLRTWDRRYGLGPSAHTAGAHRRYSPGDVARLMVLRRLTLEGVSPADAAKIAVATPVSADGRPMHTPADGYDLTAGFGPAGTVGSVGPVGTVGTVGGSGTATGSALDDFPEFDLMSLDAGAFGTELTGEEPSALRTAHLRAAHLRPPGLPTAADPTGAPAFTPAAGPVLPGPLESDAERADREADTLDPFSAADLASARGATFGPTWHDRFSVDRDERHSAAPESPWRDEPESQVDSPWLGVLRSVASDRDSSDRGTPGGGRVIAMPGGSPQSRGLARAAMSLDTYETNRMLREAIRRQGVVPTWNAMIMPVLRALGERTKATGDGIDVEHAFSEVILGVMRAVAVAQQRPQMPAPVLLACADADYHSLPLHTLAAALAEREVPCRMLGSGLPPPALAASVRRTGPSVIVLFARMSGADARGTEELRRQRPTPTVVLAGPGWQPDTVPASARTAASLGEAIDEVLRALHA